MTRRILALARFRQEASLLVTAMMAFPHGRDAWLRNPRRLPEAGRKPVRGRRYNPASLVILDDPRNRSSVFDRVISS